MRQRGSVHIILYAPNTKTGIAELSERIATVHCNAVIARLKQCSCPAAQKILLLNAIISEYKQLHQQNKGE